MGWKAGSNCFQLRRGRDARVELFLGDVFDEIEAQRVLLRCTRSCGRCRVLIVRVCVEVDLEALPVSHGSSIGSNWWDLYIQIRGFLLNEITVRFNNSLLSQAVVMYMLGADLHVWSDTARAEETADRVLEQWGRQYWGP